MALFTRVKNRKVLPNNHPASSSSAKADFLNLSQDNVHIIEGLVNGGDLINKCQCLDLSSKLSKTIHSIQELVLHCGASSNLFRPALQNLHRTLEKARLLVNNCCKEDWITESIFQIVNEKDFQVILLEVGLCYNLIYEEAKGVSEEWNFQQDDLRQSSTFMPALFSDTQKDQEALRKKLEELASPRLAFRRLSDRYPSLPGKLNLKQRLARYLLVKLECISQQSQTNDFDISSAILWTKETEPFGTWGRDRFLGSGSGTSGVSRSTWLGIPCAKKYFYGEVNEGLFLKEAGVLFHLNHPHVIKFFCCGNGHRRGDRFIAMELMEMSLSDLISRQAKKKLPFSYHVAVGIIVQIARGMCYLHGVGVAHRDLKPHNVVVNKLESSHLVEHYYVKLVDFGMSKTKVEVSKSNTLSMPGIGTTLYRAPEVHPQAHPDGKGKAIWFKADVYSYAITCAQILSLQPPFIGIQLGGLYEELKNGRRPGFPTDCPKELVALVEDCWDTRPHSRPSFSEICTRLEIIKLQLLRGESRADVGFQHVKIDTTFYQFIQRKVEEHTGVQRHHVANTNDEVEGAQLLMKPVFDERVAQVLGVLLPEQVPVERETRAMLESERSSHLSQLASADHSEPDYLELSIACIHRAKGLANGGTIELFENLCKHLSQELVKVSNFLSDKYDDLRSVNDRPALMQLYHVVTHAKMLVRKCCQKKDLTGTAWPKKALFLLGIKENILDILLHLQWWTSILKTVIVSSKSTSFSAVIKRESTYLRRAEQDFEELFNSLTSRSDELQIAALKDREHLLNMLVELQRSFAGKWETEDEHYAFLLSIQVHSLLMDGEVTQNPELDEYVYVNSMGCGGVGTVHQVIWCGCDCVLKFVYDPSHSDVPSEVKSLKRFHYPLILQFFHHWEPLSDSSPDIPVRSHMLMERMPSNLAQHIKKMKKRSLSLRKGNREKESEQTPMLPFSYPVAIDIMLQLAKAVWHMHNNNVIHRDLKPRNVLVKPVDEVPELFTLGFLQVKLGVFACARASTATSNEGVMTQFPGSTLYRAPELFSLECVRVKNYPHMVDVWSFGIVCAEILSGRRPFGEKQRWSKLSVRIRSGLRPWIPDDCPDYLRFCIESCWKYDPMERPTFTDICRMLRFAKLRSLGLMQDNHELFTFKDLNGHVVKLFSDWPTKDESPLL